MNSLLTPDGQPNWTQVTKTSWRLELPDETLTMTYHASSNLAILGQERGSFVKKFLGADCVEQLNTNVLRRIQKLSS